MEISMIAITGATGQLGRLVINHILRLQPGAKLVAAVRDPAKAKSLPRGVEVRLADYDRPETLKDAFRGVDKLLLISSNVIGSRFPQHRAVIEAAREAGVPLIVYTSLLHADTSPAALTDEHKQTEAFLKASGVAHVILRNGWYTENDTAGLAGVLAHGAYIGSAGLGRFSFASRDDYAEAAARVLLEDGHEGRIYELAGDEGLTLAEVAAETSRLSGKRIVYADLPQAEYEKALLGFGLPAPLAAILADASAKAAGGALFNDSHTLSKLIGRPTTPVKDTIAEALKALLPA
jgi:NAD(P)H dehydrogenase (quinone)